jgi:glycosyltransferase involved in cell wall biosynthesis
MISFIVPAHNEELLLGASLEAIHAAARESGIDYELIVVDDASTDATARVGESHSARVLHVTHRQIAATRNAGGRAARGDVLFFVDADTLANGAAVRSALAAIESGAVGGGCLFRFDGHVPLWAHALHPLLHVGARLLKIVGGCFLFCRRDAFEAVGGFCEDYFAGEEIHFLRALKRQGRVVIPRPRVVTSGRKVRTYSGFQIAKILAGVLVRGPGAYRTRDGLDIWYGKRPPDPGSCVPAARQ